MSNPNPKSEFDEAMEQLEKEMIKKTSLIAIMTLENKLLEAKLENYIIPDLVFDVIKLEKENYDTKI